MEKTYRVVSKIEAPLLSHSDFVIPKTIYTLVQDDNQCVRTSLQRRHDWPVGAVVQIDEELVRANRVE